MRLRLKSAREHLESAGGWNRKRGHNSPILTNITSILPMTGLFATFFCNTMTPKYNQIFDVNCPKIRFGQQYF